MLLKFSDLLPCPFHFSVLPGLYTTTLTLQQLPSTYLQVQRCANLCSSQSALATVLWDRKFQVFGYPQNGLTGGTRTSGRSVISLTLNTLYTVERDMVRVMGEGEPDLGPLKHQPQGNQASIFSGFTGGTDCNKPKNLRLNNIVKQPSIK